MMRGDSWYVDGSPFHRSLALVRDVVQQLPWLTVPGVAPCAFFAFLSFLVALL